MQNKPQKPFSTEAAILKLTNYLLTMHKILPPGFSSQITINRGHVFFSLYRDKDIFAIAPALQIAASQNRVYESLIETYDLISRYIAKTLEKNHPAMTTEALESIDIPHRKNYSRTKTCQNCYLRHKYGNKYGCFFHDNKPTRNPRARAVKCCEFWHWLDALDNIMADTLRKS